MEQKRALLWEFGIVVFLIFYFFFVQTNVSPTLGNVYIGLTIGALIIALIDFNIGKKEIRLINPNNSWIGAISFALIGYLIVIFGGQLVVKIFSGVPITNILGLLQSTAPAFSNSKIINNITFGFAIAYIESYAIFVVGYDLIASMFKVDINLQNLKTIRLWLIILGLSGLFFLLHVTAKGVTNQSALIIVFFMALVSLLIVTWTKEGRATILMHILANSLAMFLGG